MTLRKYLVLLAVIIFGSTGDSFLSRGMKQVGAIDIHHLSSIFAAIGNPWVIIGIFFLLGFMSSYMTALSFADLTFVLPATAISYINMTLISIFWLHEHGACSAGPESCSSSPASAWSPEARRAPSIHPKPSPIPAPSRRQP